MKVSFLIIAYNAEKTLQAILDDLVNQDYPHEKIEVILVDGYSEDHTKKIMEHFATKAHEFRRVIVKDNPKRTLPSGWNVALASVRGELVIKVDAHAMIPCDFISKNVACIQSGEKICGGRRPNIIDEPTKWKKTLLVAESSMFGSSIAPYRRSSQNTYVKSLFHAAYCKEVFDKVGPFNENLVRTEDNEIHYRMRQAGYKFCFNPDIISYQHTRNSLKKMLKQKYANGYWIGLTSGVCPRCLSLFHFVPLAFVLAITISTILACLNLGIFAVMLWSCYWAVAVAMAILSDRKEKIGLYRVLLPGLFLLLHLSYGIGTLVGVVKLPRWLKTLY